jgi:hypothetical protein
MLNLEKLESFLISNSDISKEFINDFFGFQKKQLYEEYKPFIIDHNSSNIVSYIYFLNLFAYYLCI